ncbi:choice-of-anchor J domain-containing protein [Flavobacteriales bacterium]|nr:choice-of-anchor J domain-containing protein [Flavobacteriales bacterium]
MFHTKLLSVVILMSSLFQCSAQNVLLDEDFENGTLPVGWTQQNNASSNGWLLGTNTQLQSQYWDITDHGNIIATNDDECDCNKRRDYLIMPAFNLSAVSGAILQFENYFDGGTLFGGTEVATIEYSTNGGTDWTILETIVGTDDDLWDTQTINLSSLVGNSDILIAFRYNDDNEWLFGWAIDDVLVYEPSGFDAELTSIDVPATAQSPSNITIGGQVTNVGATIIQDFDVNWTDGIIVNTTTVNGLNLNSGQSYQFAHPDLLMLTNSGTYPVQVYISNINGISDDDAINDTLSASVSAVEYGTISDGGYQREYIYYHPGSAPANCPLVFVCHGYGGSAQDIMNYSEFNALADEFGFAVCYPQGIEDGGGDTFWNVGYPFNQNETVDDVAFLQNLNTYLQTTYSLNPNDVFCTGMSNGGDLCYMLACQASETFRAVAPISGMILQDIVNTCSPAEEVSILEIHGTNDNVTFYNGDPNNTGGWGAYLSMAQTMTLYNNMFNLTLQSSGNMPNTNTNDGSTVSFDKYGSSTSCTQIWLYTVNNGGHDWPGAWGNMDIEASREAWNFFHQLCSNDPTGIQDATRTQKRTLLRITDVLGRETKPKLGQLLMYIYSDGTVEKKIAH